MGQSAEIICALVFSGVLEQYLYHRAHMKIKRESPGTLLSAQEILAMIIWLHNSVGGCGRYNQPLHMQDSVSKCDQHRAWTQPETDHRMIKLNLSEVTQN